VGDIGVFEVNEAFASVPLAWLAEIGPTSSASTRWAARSPWGTRWARRAPS
jgi:acetyl-CoA acetyltransferase